MRNRLMPVTAKAGVGKRSAKVADVMQRPRVISTDVVSVPVDSSALKWKAVKIVVGDIIS